MKVNVGRDISREVDLAKIGIVDTLHEGSVGEHVVYIGLRNILMDAHAGAAKIAEKDGGDVQAIAESMVDKKLDALYRGEIRVAGERTRTGDPVKAEAIRLWVADNRRKPKYKDMTDKQLKENAVVHLEGNPESIYFEDARDNIAKAERRRAEADAE